MAYMTLTDAVNICLRAVGESPVPTADSLNPYATAALDIIEENTFNILSKGWWCNTQQGVRLQPNTDGDILLPANTLAINTDDPYGGYAQRGGKLYDLYTNSDKFTSPVELNIIEAVAFEDLPYSLAKHIAYQSALMMQVSYETEGIKIQIYNERATMASVEAKREHYRNRNLNRSRRNAMGSFLSHAGMSPNANFLGGRV